MTFGEFRDTVYDWFAIPVNNDGRLPLERFIFLANDASQKIAQENKWPFLLTTNELVTILGDDVTGYYAQLPANLDVLLYVRDLDANATLTPWNAADVSVGYSGATVGNPVYYFVSDRAGQFVLNIRPCMPTSQIAIDYYRMPTLIVNPTDSFQNELMVWIPDVLMFRTLSLVARFVRDPDLATYFDGEYQQRFSDAVYRFATTASGAGRMAFADAGA